MTRPLRVLLQRFATASAWFFAASLSLAPSFAQAQDTRTILPVQSLRSGMHLIRAEVASTPQSRERGLMFRENLDANQGMLFIFDSPSIQCMWMRNTPSPLSVAFIANDGTIVNIEDMEPHTENSHCAAQPVRYALEMNRGWFNKRGIKAGNKIDGIPAPR